MPFTSWRGVVGCIKPTMRPGGLEELIRILPEGIGVIPLFLEIKEGTTDEFNRAFTRFEPQVAKLAELGCDVIHPEGAPPFMLLGYNGEAKVLDEWQKKYKAPIFTSGSNHVRALKALGVKRFVGVTYFTGSINDLFAKYFVEAGFDVLGMEGMEAAFEDVGQMSAHDVYAHVKRSFLKHPGRGSHLSARLWLAGLAGHRHAGAGSRRAGRSSGAGAVLGDPTSFDDLMSGRQGLWPATLHEMHSGLSFRGSPFRRLRRPALVSRHSGR